MFGVAACVATAVGNSRRHRVTCGLCGIIKMSIITKCRIFSTSMTLIKSYVLEKLSSNAIVLKQSPILLSSRNLSSQCKSIVAHRTKRSIVKDCISRAPEHGSSFTNAHCRNIFCAQSFLCRRFVTSAQIASESKGADGSNDVTKTADTDDKVCNSTSDVKGQTLGGFSQEAQKRCIVFTCKVCNTRSAKLFSKQAYEKGIVIIRCPGCDNLHLIADNLGWFNHFEHRNVEQMLAAKGENVKKVTDDNGTVELTLEDITGPISKLSDDK